MNRKKIAVGKWGSLIKFDRKNWGAVGGDVEAPTIYETLFHKNPDIDFYLIGKTDYENIDPSLKRRVNKNSNIHNVWNGFSKWLKQNRDNKEKFPHHEKNINLYASWVYIDEWLKTNDIVFDGGIFMAGPTGSSNVYGKTTLIKNPNKLASGLEMIGRYASHMFYFLNETRIPYILIVNDPRFFPAMPGSDLNHYPSAVLSQYTETVTQKYRKLYTSSEMSFIDIDCEYSGVETIFLIDQENQKKNANECDDLFSVFSDDDAITDDAEDNATTPDKNIHFMVVCNEGRPSRYKQLKHYILDHIEDVSIYGKWNDEITNSDSRFKGPKPFDELQEMLPRVKYTFCIPIKTGWATAKFWEMIQFGVIPFVEKTYDEQNNIGFPEILRIDSSKDLLMKIKFFEEYPDQYEKLLKQLKSLLKDELYDGSFLNNKIIGKLKEVIEDE